LKNYVQSLNRALDIVEALNEPPYELGCNELAREIGLSSSTVHRLLITLEARGYIYQNPRNSKYRLGFRLLDLKNSAFNSKLTNLKEVALYYMEKLAESSRETIGLGILDKQEVLHLARVESPEVLKANLEHFRLPATSSAIGKYLLAWLPEQKLDMILPSTFPMRTGNTITSLIKLKEEFIEIRKQNFAMDNEEGFEGVRCIATGIHDNQNNVVAAISIIAPANRFPDTKIPVFRDMLFSVAKDINNKMQMKLKDEII